MTLTSGDHAGKGLIQKFDWRGGLSPAFVGYPAGHVYSACDNCGGTWMSATTPTACAQCGKGPVTSTAPCPRCEDCDERRGGAVSKTAEDCARETLARQIVRDRLRHYGIEDDQIDAERLMEPVDHAAHGCAHVQPGQWECFNEFDSPTHQRHDWADEAAEFVCWVLDHPLVASASGSSEH